MYTFFMHIIVTLQHHHLTYCLWPKTKEDVGRGAGVSYMRLWERHCEQGKVLGTFKSSSSAFLRVWRWGHPALPGTPGEKPLTHGDPPYKSKCILQGVPSTWLLELLPCLLFLKIISLKKSLCQRDILWDDKFFPLQLLSYTCALTTVGGRDHGKCLCWTATSRLPKHD